MKKRWVVLIATIVVLGSVSGISNYQATHTGPFEYYRQKYPELSTTEIARHGSKDINGFFALPQSSQSVGNFTNELKIICKEFGPSLLEFYTREPAYKNIVKGMWCDHEYGLFFGQNKWRVTYLINSDDKIIGGNSMLICPACQGIWMTQIGCFLTQRMRFMISQPRSETLIKKYGRFLAQSCSLWLRLRYPWIFTQRIQGRLNFTEVSRFHTNKACWAGT